jgi:hypothetical protein
VREGFVIDLPGIVALQIAALMGAMAAGAPGSIVAIRDRIGHVTMLFDRRKCPQQ